MLVFVAWTRVEGAGVQFMADHFTVSAGALADGRVWTLLTAAFSHFDTTHLIFNGLVIWFFGRTVAVAWGTRSLVGLYLVGAVLSSFAHVGWNALSGDPTPALGASGSAMALAVATAWLAPNARVLLFFVLPIPMWALVPLYVVMDVAGLFGAPPGGVANAAHLGGVLAGAIWVWFKRRELGRPARPPGEAS